MTDLNAECKRAWEAYRIAHNQAMENGQALQEARSENQSLSDRIDVLAGLLREARQHIRTVDGFVESENRRSSRLSHPRRED